MPEIKNTFLQGKMNKDLDERLIPNGQYRDAMNIEVATSEGSDVGTVQNIMGNKRFDDIVPSDCVCVGSIVDEKNNKIYWFIKRDVSGGSRMDAILEYSTDFGAVPVIVDTKIGTADAVLKFPNKIITGINIIDNLLFWTDGVNEPRKINIDECKKGTTSGAGWYNNHTQIIPEKDSFNAIAVEVVSSNESALWDGSPPYWHSEEPDYPLLDEHGVAEGRHVVFYNDHLETAVGVPFPHSDATFTLKQYRNGELIREGLFAAFNDGSGYGNVLRYASNIGGRDFRVGDILHFPNVLPSENSVDIQEKHITVIKSRPTKALSVKINPLNKRQDKFTREFSNEKDSLFEKILPRFSYRYKYIDNEYSSFAPFTNVIFNPTYKKDYDVDTGYSVEELYNTSMVNDIESLELMDFVSANIPEDVKQIDILYKQEDSPVIYSIANITRDDPEWHSRGSGQGTDLGEEISSLDYQHIEGGNYKGRYILKSENIYAAIPENQILRPWDAVPRKALAQEITGNRIVYGNYTEGYDVVVQKPKIISDYKPRTNLAGPTISFDQSGLPSIKSKRNYQLGIVFGDKYGRETPVFTSTESAVEVPWKNKEGLLLASQSNQLISTLDTSIPNFAEYIKFYIKETSGEYYNMLMQRIYIPDSFNAHDDLRDHVWMSFPSSDINKVKEGDYITLKKKIGKNEQQFPLENKFKILDIKAEAPDAVKYDYLNYGTQQNNTSGDDGFGTGANSYFNRGDTSRLFGGAKPISNGDTATNLASNSEFVLRIDNWLANAGDHDIVGNDWYGTPLVDDNGNTIEDLYFSMSRPKDGGTVHSQKYKIVKAYIFPANTDYYIVKLNRPISQKDSFSVAQNVGVSNVQLHDELTIRIEKRVEKDLSLFSGKFFVKVVSNEILNNDGDSMGSIENPELLSNYIVSSQNPLYWAYERNSAADNPDAGIIHNDGLGTGPNSWGANDEIADLITGATVPRTPSHWSEINDTLGKKFFIDNLSFVAGQISDDNYARNAGQIWRGNPVQYPSNPVWVGSNLKGVITLVNGVPASITGTGKGDYKSVSRGWFHDNKNIGSWSSKQDEAVNGMEGVVQAHNQHVNKHDNYLTSGVSGWRRWAYNHSGKGLENAHKHFDNTYGIEGERGRVFMHMSFLAPGVDLVDTLPNSSNLWDSSTSMPATGLQGIWGGGIFTADNDDATANNFGVNDDYRIIPMEGKQTGSNGEMPDNEDETTTPGPNVPNTFGYDSRYADRHYNQWNPTFGLDQDYEEYQKLQEFIFNIKAGAKFKFQNDSSGEIYTIKNVTTKKIYNHTPWRTRYHWDNSESKMVPAGDSVEEAAIAYAEYFDTGENSNTDTVPAEDARDALRSRIMNFGRAHNRRLTYIIELDKNPNLNDTLNLLDGSTINVNDAVRMEFITNSPTALLTTSFNKSAIFETEPKDTANLDIYYEASDTIPTVINKKTREDFAPVGSVVELIGFPLGTNGKVVIRQKVHLRTWLGEGNDFELYPGFNSMDADDNEINYSDVMIRFYKQDGSYNTSRLAPMSSNPDFNLSNYRTEFRLLSETPVGMENGLSWFNCYSFGNGIESNRIRDDFNTMKITNGVRASSTIEKPYAEENKKSGLIYSGIYNSNSGINNLNQFIAAEKITKDINPTYGSIQKLFSRNTDLITFCEDRVVKILANKDAVFNADGNPNLTATENVLGQTIPFIGDYGISKNPESFASESYRAYFTDKQRGAVLRLSRDGLTPISDMGMHDWFRDNLVDPNELIGTYDTYKGDYNLTLTRYFSENLLFNADIAEGKPQFFATPPTVELLDNGDFAAHSILSLPTIGFDNTDIDGRLMIDDPDYTFESTTTITNHAVIPVGNLQAAVTGQTGWSASDSVWTANTLGYAGTEPDWVLFEHFLCSGTNNSTPYHNNLNPFDSTSNSNLNHGYVYHRDQGYAYGGSNPPLKNDLDMQLDNLGQAQWPGSSSGPAAIGHYNARNVPATANFSSGSVTGDFGIYVRSMANAPMSMIFPYSHPNGMPTGEVDADILNWGGNSQNTDGLDPTNTGYANYDTANDTTIFAGEEVEVFLAITFPHKGNSTQPYQVIDMSIQLKDGATDIDDDLIFGSSDTITSSESHNISYDANDGTWTHSGFDGNSDPYRDFSQDPSPFGDTNPNHTHNNVGYHNTGLVNFSSKNKIKNPQDFGTAYDAVTDGQNTSDTYFYKAKFKFVGKDANGAITWGQEGIVVDNLNVELYARNHHANWTGSSGSPTDHQASVYYFVQKIGIRKILKLNTPENLGMATITAVPAVPSSEIPAWAQVQHALTNSGAWVTNHSGNNPSHVLENSAAISTYGAANAATSVTEDNITYNTGTSNNTTAYNAYSNGSYTTTDYLAVDCDSTWANMDYSLTDSGSGPTSTTFEADNWYMVDVLFDKPGAGESIGSVAVNYVMGQNAGNSGNAMNYGNAEYPRDHLGYITNTNAASGTSNNVPWSGDLRNIQLANITPGDALNNQTNPLAALSENSVPMNTYSNGYNTSNTVHYRAIFKFWDDCFLNNAGSWGSKNTLRITFGNHTDTRVKWVHIWNISQPPTDPTISNWQLINQNDKNHLWSKYELYPTYNYTVNKDVVRFKDSEYIAGGVNYAEILEQKFDTDPNIPFNLVDTQNGYEFRFTLTNVSGSSELRIQIAGAIGNVTGIDSYSGNDEFEGAYLTGIDDPGQYVVTFNPKYGDTPTMTKDGVAHGLAQNFQTAWAGLPSKLDHLDNPVASNKIRIHAEAGSGPFSGDLTDFSLVDLGSNVITGGSVEHWEFVGFNPANHQFIIYDDNIGAIRLNDAFTDTQIRQVVNKDVKTGDNYRVRFNHNITSGEISVYYFNNTGDGFRMETFISSTNSPGYFDQVFQIGDAVIGDNGPGSEGTTLGGELYNTFVVVIKNGYVNGTLDAFSMQQEFLDFTPTTITFSEKSKGWVSFKSFIPENGNSLAGQYYTMKNGYLYRHNDSDVYRNQFYDQSEQSITESHVIAILNQDPSLVKKFNTLTYEGSRQRIAWALATHGYQANYEFETIMQATGAFSPYNPDSIENRIKHRDGWYIDYIKTDGGSENGGETGSVKQFINKENKKFSFIHGDTDWENNPDPKDFSLRGLGIITSLNQIDSTEDVVDYSSPAPDVGDNIGDVGAGPINY